MSLLQSILIAFVYYFGSCNLFASYVTVYRPIVCGFLVGCILGEPSQGAIIGASINLIYIGFMSVGGSLPGDPCLAGTLSTALAITYGYSTDMAISIAVPLALLGTLLWVGNMTANCFFVRISEKFIDQGKQNLQIIPAFVLPMVLKLIWSWFPVMLACYFGADYIQSALNALSGNVLSALSVVGGMLPAIGVAMNLQAIYKGNARIFLFVGFAITAYTALPTMAVAIIGVACAVIYTQLESAAEGSAA